MGGGLSTEYSSKLVRGATWRTRAAPFSSSMHVNQNRELVVIRCHNRLEVVDVIFPLFVSTTTQRVVRPGEVR